MEEKYKGWIIRYRENKRENKFEAIRTGGLEEEEITLISDTLTDIKDQIDKWKKKKFKRIPVVSINYNQICTGEITSIAKQDRDSGYVYEFWLTRLTADGDKYRGKEFWGSRNTIYHLDTANQKIVDEIFDLKKQIKEIEMQIHDKKQKFQKPVTNDDIKNSLE